MELIARLFQTIENIWILLYNANLLIIFTLLVLIYHFIAFLLFDRLYINAIRQHRDPKNIAITDLDSLPLINIVIPAWKEGKEFRDCLDSITKISYPHIKTIINAGGSEECLSIANLFRKYDNFIILNIIKVKLKIIKKGVWNL